MSSLRSLDDLCRHVRERTARVRVHGVHGSFTALAVARAAAAAPVRPLVVVVPD